METHKELQFIHAMFTSSIFADYGWGTSKQAIALARKHNIFHDLKLLVYYSTQFGTVYPYKENYAKIRQIIDDKAIELGIVPRWKSMSGRTERIYEKQSNG